MKTWRRESWLKSRKAMRQLKSRRAINQTWRSGVTSIMLPKWWRAESVNNQKADYLRQLAAAMTLLKISMTKAESSVIVMAAENIRAPI
jgi:hypothetical protein